jgi:methionyl-tRNA formyltransferase
MRIVFIGTAPFACPSLDGLAEAHDVALVVTQPDRPAGRKHKLNPPAIKVAAQKLGLKVIQPVQINSDHSVEALRAAEPEAIVVAAYGQILRRVVFSLPAQGTINIHASLLPRHRGAAPIPWAIIHGDDVTGITTFLIDEGMDTGKILLSESLYIDSDETASDLHDRLAILGSRVILRTLGKIESGDINPIAQQEKNASLAPKLD